MPAESFDDVDAYVATRVRELPRPHVPSQRRNCSKCAEAVWVSNGMASVANRLPIVCVVCALQAISSETEQH